MRSRYIQEVQGIHMEDRVRVRNQGFIEDVGSQQTQGLQGSEFNDLKDFPVFEDQAIVLEMSRVKAVVLVVQSACSRLRVE